ncbi:STABILIZED1-like [Micractinium conductrix]|uniref:STABILIZED1-like n=1 Tax=Micractinium conductrix TaxID=554055 RepID=A0A2P6VBP3_9CHLO|nr:STABILIZED1-like [Micractinium conductrix]|eukprot:PSC71481.1 STABILIZED1-like [Micractinium conductrix]
MSRQGMRPTPLPPGSKVDFNALRAPSNYVAGLGRGASGFTTRSDIGPSMPGADGDKKEGGAAGGDETKFDEFLGNDAGVLGAGAYDDEDKEADEVWDHIEDRMEERRKVQREAKLKEELEKFRADNPKIQEQFADLKRKLAEVPVDQWESIPDIGDYTIKKQKHLDRFTPVPDSLLASAAASQATASAIDASGLATPMGGATTDLTAIGAGRNTVVQLKLDKISDSVSGQTVVDPKGYLTDLKSVTLKSDAEISDIKKARLLLKSVISTNPRHAPGWIAAARLEEVAGKLQQARELAMKGCEMCPSNEDVWLEAARLQTPENAKAILARGVAALPDSVKLWMQAARLEQTDEAKKRVLLRALERIPQSVRLWKAVVEISEEDDARVLLSRAVECCPQHVELWLALARLETYENARKVLNKARQAVPTSAEVWITASKLEEANGQPAMPDKIIPRGIKSLAANGVVIDRDWWLKEAESSEKSHPPHLATCRAIVKEVVGHGVEEEDRKRTSMADAEECMRRGSAETARAIYAHALSVFPGKKSIWRRAAQLEKASGTAESLDALLRKAVQYCPQAEVLWLMAAKEKWLSGDVAGARSILEEAFVRNPDSEEIWLAAFKVEFENAELDRARLILAKAREHAPASTARVWMKSAMVEREAGQATEERQLLTEGIRRFPSFWKLHLMLGQLEERQGHADAARLAYAAGIKRNMDAIPLWVAAARLEERGGNVAKARALLEQARLKNPKQPALWLAAVRTETRAQNTKAAEALMAKALQDCPDSGPLWAETINMAPRPQRKSRSVDALKKCNDDPFVVAAVAGLFWADRKVDKARSWFNRAVTLNPDVGDFWASYFKFECQFGGPEQQEAVMKRFVAAEPRHGERWQRVAKDPANVHQKPEALLKRVVLDLDKDL